MVKNEVRHMDRNRFVARDITKREEIFETKKLIFWRNIYCSQKIILGIRQNFHEINFVTSLFLYPVNVPFVQVLLRASAMQSFRVPTVKDINKFNNLITGIFSAYLYSRLVFVQFWGKSSRFVTVY